MTDGARGAACLVALVLALGWTSPARAQAMAPVASQTLFDEGRALLDKKAFDAACPKLAASERLDPAVGTLLSLGQCEEGRGRTASAWLAYREATGLATSRGDEKRRLFATEKAAALEPRLARILIRVPTAAPGLTVHRDGVVVDPAMFGTATPTDPGSYLVHAEAPGMRAWSSTISVRGEGGTVEVVVPSLEPGGPEAGDTGAARVQASGGRGARRTIALVVGGVGVVGVGIGAAFGVATISKWSDVSSKCPSGRCPSAAALADETAAKSSASSSATLSTVFFGVGAAALVTGAVLWLTARSDSKGASERTVRLVPTVGVGTGGASVVGTF